MNYPADMVMAWIASYAWPYSRLAAMLMTMFVVGSQNVPVMVRAKLAIVVTAAMAPLLPAMPEGTDLHGGDQQQSERRERGVMGNFHGSIPAC